MIGTALITGASSGIGAELARLHAARGQDLVIVARRAPELAALKAELETAHAVTCHVVVADLTADGAALRIRDEVRALGVEIDILINNAGFGGHGPFLEQPADRPGDMVSLNVTALTELCRYFGADMVARGRGRILNVSSTAGFLPGPLMAVYFATKAYVNSFSQALAGELGPAGVSVTVLCPGPVRTEFADVAGMDGLSMLDKAIEPARTARAGYEAMMKGHLIAWDDWRLRLMLDWIVPLMPRALLVWVSRRVLTK